MKARGALIVMGLVALMGVGMPPAQAARQATNRYVAGAGDPFANALTFTLTKNYVTGWCGASGSGVGGACFEVEAGETTLDVRVDDATGLALSGYVSFREPGSGDSPLSGTEFCERTTVPIPGGATRAVVVLSSYPVCGTTAGTPTTGTITASFS